jgi:hypothetical protein
MRIQGLSATLVWIVAFSPFFAAARDLQSLKVLYIGDGGSEREQGIVSFLKPYVKSVDAANRADFQPGVADGYDVVVLDWPQGPWDQGPNWGANLVAPLGLRQKWAKPTVLLGSAGLNLAVAWQVRGGSGCTCLFPLAYGLRDHEIFEQPFKVDRTRTASIPTPEAFGGEIKDPTIDVLPLVDDIQKPWRHGWCTYAADFPANPDIEYFCGGVNEKTSTAAGLWRQGNLLHFGFEQSPAEMNQNGRNLLLNSIAYISRFSQDRPIARTPSVFAGRVAVSRDSMNHRLASNAPWVAEWISQEGFAPELAAELGKMARPDLIAWGQANRNFVRPDENNQLCLDEDLKSLNIAFDDPAILDRVVELLRGDAAQQAKARRLATRYLPEMPVDTAQAASAWLAENRAYLFATDAAIYRWYIDPLAKQRGIASRDLRGPRREDHAGQG